MEVLPDMPDAAAVAAGKRIYAEMGPGHQSRATLTVDEQWARMSHRQRARWTRLGGVVLVAGLAEWPALWPMQDTEAPNA